MTQTIAYDAEKPRVIAGPMTYEEFLEWDGDPHVEWVNGWVTTMAPIGDAHDELHGLLVAVLRARAQFLDDGVVRMDPFQMKLATPPVGRAPDLQYILKHRSHILKKTYTDGPADLVIEVVSPGTRGVDRGEKYDEYEQGGVAEYWLLDPERNRFEFYQRGAAGTFMPAAVPDDGVYRSRAIPGLWIRIEWLSQRPLPTIVSVLKEWGIV